MSLSFGVAAASLVTATFIPDRFRSNPAEMLQGNFSLPSRCPKASDLKPGLSCRRNPV